MPKLSPPKTMKSPVRAARSRSGRTAGRPGTIIRGTFSEEILGDVARGRTRDSSPSSGSQAASQPKRINAIMPRTSSLV
jgi:hypothetical protein